MLGLMEYLETQGGSSELFQVVAQTHVPFEKVLSAVKAAEMLDFVDTPKRLVILTPLGIRFIRAGMEERKEIWKARLLDLKLFRVVQEQLELHEGQLTREELIAEIQSRLPMENPEQTFETLVAWGRFGELFAYREEKGVLTPE
jgi:NitT/TauT family transport system ATP-binding protein